MATPTFVCRGLVMTKHASVNVAMPLEFTLFTPTYRAALRCSPTRASPVSWSGNSNICVQGSGHAKTCLRECGNAVGVHSVHSNLPSFAALRAALRYSPTRASPVGWSGNSNICVQGSGHAKTCLRECGNAVGVHSVHSNLPSYPPPCRDTGVVTSAKTQTRCWLARASGDRTP